MSTFAVGLDELQGQFQRLRAEIFDVQLEGAHRLPCGNPAHGFDGPCFWVDEIPHGVAPGSTFDNGQTVLVGEICAERFARAGVLLGGFERITGGNQP